MFKLNSRNPLVANVSSELTVSLSILSLSLSLTLRSLRERRESKDRGPVFRAMLFRKLTALFCRFPLLALDRLARGYLTSGT